MNEWDVDDDDDDDDDNNHLGGTGLGGLCKEREDDADEWEADEE